MNSVQYLNEHIWIHYVGHFLILLAFFSAMFAIVSGYLQRAQPSPQWLLAIKLAYIIHFSSILSAIGLILYMMQSHYYEFEYVWAHVSDELPMRYILSAFWEGQEGSFLLWMFWNGILGIYFCRQQNKLRTSVLLIILGVNAILTSMLLGVHFGEIKLGSSPFNLLRYTMDIPLFANADYVSLIKGNGLNPLLQNYWMIIHPPTLFLGFASTIIPFAYACSALIHKDQQQWLKEALPWSLFSGFVLGTGILMGGAWAYEALSFGGYWAWDPVENMSLAPWLILVAGIHANLIANATTYSLKPTFILYFLSFIFVCYSSFLTRSGILGDSSAHAFTQMGLEWQLVALCVFSTIFPFYTYWKQIKYFPSPQKEEDIHSREFWMFIGSLTLLFSALLISFTTSIPVYNKILDLAGSISGNNFTHLHRSIPLDPISHHNQFQIWIAIFISLLSGTAVYLKYLQPEGPSKKTILTLVSLFLLSLVSSTVVYKISFVQLHWSHFLFLFSAWFALFTSAYFFLFVLKANLKLAASVLSHCGFGILVLGILFTGVNKQILSTNKFAQEGLLENPDMDELSKHITLIRNESMFMNGYWVEYSQDTFIQKIRKYTLQFWKEDTSGNRTETFTLYPEIQYDNKLTKVAASNPSIKRSVHQDIFSLIAQIPQSQVDAESAKQAEDSLVYKMHFIKPGDSIETNEHLYVLKNIHTQFTPIEFEVKPNDQQFQMELEVIRKEDRKMHTSKPAILFRNNLIYKFPAKMESFGLRLNIPDTLYSSIVPPYQDLEKKLIQIRKEEILQISDKIQLKLLEIGKNVPQEIIKETNADIAVSAILEISSAQEKSLVECYFVIRGHQIISLPVSTLSPGISIRFVKINPQTEEMTFEYGLHPDLHHLALPFEIAENAPRTDFIVIQLIRFPWINLVWLGSIFMVAGLLLASYHRRKVLSDVL
ncbi:MAG: cytochrome c biogenesis protein CcsA [Saprospiraceae bacterium]|nr:cytochrome c biogenesis protein CcsA [Saprospiraceae bacterium]